MTINRLTVMTSHDKSLREEKAEDFEPQASKVILKNNIARV